MSIENKTKFLRYAAILKLAREMLQTGDYHTFPWICMCLSALYRRGRIAHAEEHNLRTWIMLILSKTQCTTYTEWLNENHPKAYANTACVIEGRIDWLNYLIWKLETWAHKEKV